MEDNCIQATFRKKPLAVCLANNHIMDYGVDGYRDTLTALKSSGIYHFGAGTIGENCNNPLVLPVQDTLVGLAGYVCPTTDPVFAQGDRPGVMPITLDHVEKDILTARRKGAQRIIINLHWGVEGVGAPRPEDVQLARKILQCGADMIIGHHTHCIQSYEMCGSKGVFYGLGNCIFPNDWDLRPSASEFSRFRVCLPAESGLSMMIRLDLDCPKTTPFVLRFDGAELKPAKTRMTRFSLPSMGREDYSRYYHRRQNRDLLLFSLGAFLVQPRLPKPAAFFRVIHRLLQGAGIG
jgi:poly-gamma-glutamate synthesis protein (capsule biosynthesis protein)